jgi:hypothetical protein
MIRQLMGSVSLPALIASQLAFAAPASAHTYIAGFAEGCGAPAAAVSTGMMTLFVKRMGPGDKLIAYDAPRREVIAETAVPDSEIYRQPAVRVRQSSGQLAQLGRFLKARCSAAGNGAHAAESLYAPQFFDEIERNVVAAEPRGSVSVMLVGSALYEDPRDPDLSMAGGHYPSDGFLNAAPAASVFSTSTRRQALGGVDVHYCFTDPNWSSDAEKEGVQRFWSLYVSTQGGKLATFTGDLATCFDRFEHGVTAGAPSFTVAAGASDLKMMLAQRAPVTRQEVAAQPPAPIRARVIPVQTAATRAQPVPAPRTDPDRFMDEHAAISTERPQTLVGLVRIGIRWSCPNVDLDLYARGSPDHEFLYYGHPDSNEGHFPHDYTSPPNGSAVESVEFRQPIDLSKMEAFVNFFGGNCPGGPDGVVRIWFNNHVYEDHFALQAEEGNHGAQVLGHMWGSDWTEIDVKKLVGIH